MVLEVVHQVAVEPEAHERIEVAHLIVGVLVHVKSVCRPPAPLSEINVVCEESEVGIPQSVRAIVTICPDNKTGGVINHTSVVAHAGHIVHRPAHVAVVLRSGVLVDSITYVPGYIIPEYHAEPVEVRYTRATWAIMSGI